MILNYCFLQNNPIAGYMARLGLQPISALDKAKDKFAVFLKRNDLENPAKGMILYE